MHAYVQVLTGPTSGQKLVIRPGEVLEFGRTELADVPFEHDQAMSSVHFALRSTGTECRLRDLGSTNGTFVNDVPASDTVLANGDVILAGSTELAVYLHDMPEEVARGDTEIRPRPAAGIPRAVQAPRSRAAYRLQPCDSGLARLRGGGFGQPQQPAAPSQLVGMLNAWSTPYLVVDFAQLQDPPREVVTEIWPLFDWLPEEVARERSPLVVTPAHCQAWDALIDAAWDQDLLVCFFSSLDLTAMVAHLRSALQLKARGADGGLPRGMLGYYYPSVLSQLLAVRSPAFAEDFLGSIEAVLLEVADTPQSWQVFTRPAHVAALAKAGLAELAVSPDENELAVSPDANEMAPLEE